MPMRYTQARVLLETFTEGRFHYTDINPLWLANGINPKRLINPLYLPPIGAITGEEKDITFSKFVEKYRSVITCLSKENPDPVLPESWLLSYLRLISMLQVKSIQTLSMITFFGKLLSGSARQFLPHSKEADEILRLYEKLENPPATEKNILHSSSEFHNIENVESEIQELLNKVRRLTEPKGMRTRLASDLGVPLPRISEWLAGKYEPSGAVTLKLLKWVQEQEAKK